MNCKTKKSVSILIFLVLLAAFCGCKKEEERTLAAGHSTDGAAPYTWEEQKNGSYTIKIAGNRSENSGWELYSGDETVLSVTQEKDDEKQSVFTVTPLTFGTADVTLKYLESGLPVDYGMLFRFSFYVDENGLMSLEEESSAQLSAERMDTAYGTIYYVGGEELLRVYLPGEGIWTPVSRSGSASAGVYSVSGFTCAEFTPMDDGEGQLVLSNSETGALAALSVMTTDGTISVTACGEPEPETEAAASEQEELPEISEEYQELLNQLEQAESDESRRQLMDEWNTQNSQSIGEILADIPGLQEEMENLLAELSGQTEGEN